MWVERSAPPSPWNGVCEFEPQREMAVPWGPRTLHEEWSCSCKGEAAFQFHTEILSIQGWFKGIETIISKHYLWFVSFSIRCLSLNPGLISIFSVCNSQICILFLICLILFSCGERLLYTLVHNTRQAFTKAIWKYVLECIYQGFVLRK